LIEEGSCLPEKVVRRIDTLSQETK